MRRTASGTCAARSPTRKNDPRARRAARRSRTRSVQSRSGPSSKVSATRRAAWLPRHTQPSVSTWAPHRSEEHTSELQSQSNLVCRLLLEKKNEVPNLVTHRTPRVKIGDVARSQAE